MAELAETRENFAQLFEASIVGNNMVPGSIIKAKVVEIATDFITLNAGLKSEAIVPINEFYDERGALEVSVGDDIDVTLDAVEDGFGETILSREKAKRQEAWRYLEKAQKANETVKGIIMDKVKGGFTVAVGHVCAFLPGSLVDIHPVRDFSLLENKEFEFKVIKMDQKRNNIVMSRRAVIEEESSAEREALLESLHEGQELKGIVKNITDYGAFIDLGGIDGLLHITDMCWKRVKHPSDILSLGQEVNVKILSFNQERQRVSLGMKQLSEDPWLELIERYPEGVRFTGKVTNVTDYGCFVEIKDGIEGLVHMSEMDWTNKNIHPARVVQANDEVEVVVLEIDKERRRISLGIKQCIPNPWEEFASKHKKDDKIKGEVRSITDFGLFIGLEGNIDGLVHLSDISWTVPGEGIVNDYKKGEEVEAVILGIDPERERISLGIKQLIADPFVIYIEQHSKGDIVTGKVVEVRPKIALVELAPEVVGNLRISEVSSQRIDDLKDELEVDAAITAKIINVDKRNRTISLSIKANEMQAEADTLRKYSRENQEASTKATLGDIFKEKMGQKKDQDEDS